MRQQKCASVAVELVLQKIIPSITCIANNDKVAALTCLKPNHDQYSVMDIKSI